VSDDRHHDRDARETEITADGSPEPADVEPARHDVDSGTKDPHGAEGGKGADEDSPKKLTKKDILKMLAIKNQMIEELTEKSTASEAEAKEFKDKWLRSVAEFENYRKRTRKEWELLQRQSKAEVITEILSVVDDFERAFTVVGERDDDVVQGIRLIYNNLTTSLDRIGVHKMNAMDTPFDPVYHMAVAQIDKDGADSNHVVEIVQEGYLLGDTVIRPPKS